MRHYTCDPALRERLAESGRDVRLDDGLAPLIGRLGEDLNSGGPDGHTAGRRGRHPPWGRDVGPRQVGRRSLTHPPLVIACPTPANRRLGLACSSPAPRRPAPTDWSGPSPGPASSSGRRPTAPPNLRR